MAKTKKVGKKSITKKAGKRSGSRAVVKHPSRNQVKVARVAKVRHMKDRRGRLHVIEEDLPSGLVAKPMLAQPKSKHRSYFEFVENTEKKKKLEFTVTNNREPPPGYEFVPIGNPALTAACKELSREQEAMIFIVSTYSDKNPGLELGVALNRVGHHIRERIVQQARDSLGEMEEMAQQARLDVPEPIPEDQEEINKQADAAIRDLFPRIPNTDRQIIIEHSFKKGAKGPDGMPLVGLAADLTLSRRVQLAVVSHIRHTHTRYDQLLRETTWANARRAVEELCLDILVKWRGDEESGRDQLDEILREVVVISDSEDDYEDDDDDDEDDEEDDGDEDADAEDTDMTSGDSSDETNASAGNRPPLAEHQGAASGSRSAHADPPAALVGRPSTHEPDEAERVKAAAIRAHRGFQRYQAVRDQAWQQAISRHRRGHHHTYSGPSPATMGPPESKGDAFQISQESEAYYHPSGLDRSDHARPSDYYARQRCHAQHVSPDRLIASHSRPPPFSYDNGQGYRVGDGHGSGYAPVVGSRPEVRSSPRLRTAMSRPLPEDLKDYLVPSIEPSSPLASRFQAQSLDDRLLDQSSDHRQPMPALHHANLEPQHPSSLIPDEGFIRVYRQPRYHVSSEPMPYASSHAGVVATRDKGAVRLELRQPAFHRPIPLANHNFHHGHTDSSARIDYVSADLPSSLQERSRFAFAPNHRDVYEAATEPGWHPDVRTDSSGARYRDATHPVDAEDRRTWEEAYHTYAAPFPDDGNGARYRDASRPIVVEDEPAWRDRYGPSPAQFRVAEVPARVPVRQEESGKQGYSDGRRGFGQASPRTAPHEDDFRSHPDFIPVANMFPRPHAPPAKSDETRPVARAYPGRFATMGSSTARPPGNGHDQHYLHDTLESRANLARQERIVRYEYVNHGQGDEGRVQRVYDAEDLHRAPGPPTGPIVTGTYGAPPAPRRSRQEGVIYIE